MTVIKIENFGPINKGEIELGDLTILAGYPNTGKSYTAKIIYSLNIIPELAQVLFSMKKEFIAELYNTIKKEKALNDLLKIAKEIIDDIKRCKEESEKRIIFNIIVNNYHQALVKALNNIVSVSFYVVFGDYGNNLLKESKIEISREEFSLAIVNGSIKDLKYKNKWILEGELMLRYKPGLLNFVNINELYSFNDITELKIEDIANTIFRYIIQKIINEFIAKLLGQKWYYIPYGRSQIVQLLSSLLRALDTKEKQSLQKIILSYKGIWFLEPTIIPSKYIESFFEGTLNYNRRNRTIGHMIRELVEIIINGKIKINIDETTKVPIEYRYSFNNKSIDMYNASAFISEISGLVIPLHVVKSNENIIIEEPEAQLHPHFQRIIAWLLAYISSLGSRILITTHSDYLLTELGIISHIISKKVIDKGSIIIKELLGIKSNKALNIIEMIVNCSPKIKIYIFQNGLIEKVEVSKLVEEIPTSINTLSQQLKHIILISSEK